MSEIVPSPEPRDAAVSSGGAIDERVDEIQQRAALGWRQLIVRVIFWLSLDVIIGCAVYFLSCGKECRDHFSGETTNRYADSLYFSSTTLTTTGFGDVAPTAATSKTFTALYIAFNSFYINFFVYPPFVRLVQMVEGRNRGRGRRLVLAICYCLICLFSSIPFLICLGGLGWGNAFYTVVVSFSSTGYGDYTFAKMWGRVFNSLWLLTSHLVNYRLGGLVTEAGDDLLLKKDNDVRDPAAAADVALAAQKEVEKLERERDVAQREVEKLERERDAAQGEVENLVLERNALVNLAVAARGETDAAVAAQNSARDNFCMNLVYASWHMQAADTRRDAAEERFNQLVQEIGVAVQETVGRVVLMLTDASFDAAVLEYEKVEAEELAHELDARLKDAEYDLTCLQNPT